MNALFTPSNRRFQVEMPIHRPVFGGVAGTAEIAGIAAALALLSGAMANAGAVQAQNKTERLSSQEIHERCLDLAMGQYLSYSFVASKQLEFAIYYRQGDRLFYPVKKQVRNTEGKFTPQTTGTYCLTWHNPDAHRQVVRYELAVHGPNQPRASKK